MVQISFLSVFDYRNSALYKRVFVKKSDSYIFVFGNSRKHSFSDDLGCDLRVFVYRSPIINCRMGVIPGSSFPAVQIYP